MDSIFNKEITEIIRCRYSVRNYEDKLLKEEEIKNLEDYISKVENPFNIKIRINLIKKEDLEDKVKVGTYGVIKGAKYYLTAVCEKKEFALEALGYTFEKVILYCTSLGLGTVWLGGTFSKGGFSKAIDLKENEILQIVSPVGYEGGKKSLLASLMGDHKNKRKDYSELFFNGDFDTKLLLEDAGAYGEALEMIRLAPSANNMQPWRIVKINNDIHIYTNGKINMSKIDIGIALCHFDLYTKEKKIKGEFKFTNPSIESKCKYVISWIRK
jgi:Putative TM nitroreductase